VEFLHRGSQVASVTGEKLTAAQVSLALEAVSIRHGWDLTSVVLVPVVDDPPFYYACVEVGTGAGPEDMLPAIDQELMKISLEYAGKRGSGRLGPLREARVAEGTLMRIRDERIAASRGTLEQYKQPCLITTEHEARSLGLLVV